MVIVVFEFNVNKGREIRLFYQGNTEHLMNYVESVAQKWKSLKVKY